MMTCKSGKTRGTVEVITEGLDQLDVTFDHHRLESLYVTDGKHTLKKPVGTHRVEVAGCGAGGSSSAAPSTTGPCSTIRRVDHHDPPEARPRTACLGGR